MQIGAQTNNRPLNNLEIEERATEAEVLLNSKVLWDAFDDVYSRQVGILLGSDVGSLTAGQAHAMLKALEEIRHQLDQYLTDRKMRRKFAPKGEKDAG